MESINKYLIFSIMTEYYAIPIINVKEIIRYEQITPIRDSQKYLKGVINLRGKIIPIVDMRLKLGIEENEFNDRTIIIIVDINGEKDIFSIGITVDSVHEVIDIPDSNIEEAPKVGLKLKSQYIQGIAKIRDNMAMIFNIDKILLAEEIEQIEKTSTA
jgi:purine-binding chemotaxis protein CheW